MFCSSLSVFLGLLQFSSFMKFLHGLSSYQNSSPWPTSRGFLNDNAGTSSFIGSQYGQEKWEYYFGSNNVYSTQYPNQQFLTSSPIIGNDGTIYIGMPSGIFYAMSPQGSIKWSFNHGGTLTCQAMASNSPTNSGYYNGYSSPVIDSNGIIYVTTLCSLYALSSTNGALLWVFPVAGYNVFISSPVVGANNIIYTCIHVFMYCFKFVPKLLDCSH